MSSRAWTSKDGYCWVVVWVRTTSSFSDPLTRTDCSGTSGRQQQDRVSPSTTATVRLPGTVEISR